MALTDLRKWELSYYTPAPACVTFTSHLDLWEPLSACGRVTWGCATVRACLLMLFGYCNGWIGMYGSSCTTLTCCSSVRYRVKGHGLGAGKYSTCKWRISYVSVLAAFALFTSRTLSPFRALH